MRVKLPIGKIRKAIYYLHGKIELKLWNVHGEITANVLHRDSDPTADLQEIEPLTRGTYVRGDSTGLVELEMNLIDGFDDYLASNVQVFIFAGEAYTILPRQFENELSRAVYVASRRVK